MLSPLTVIAPSNVSDAPVRTPFLLFCALLPSASLSVTAVPAWPVFAPQGCMEGFHKFAAHCPIIDGSHSWWRTEAARFPTF